MRTGEPNFGLFEISMCAIRVGGKIVVSANQQSQPSMASTSQAQSTRKPFFFFFFFQISHLLHSEPVVMHQSGKTGVRAELDLQQLVITATVESTKMTQLSNVFTHTHIEALHIVYNSLYVKRNLENSQCA